MSTGKRYQLLLRDAPAKPRAGEPEPPPVEIRLRSLLKTARRLGFVCEEVWDVEAIVPAITREEGGKPA